MARAPKLVEQPVPVLPPVEPWHALANVAIARQAVLHRVGRGRPPDTLAGLVLDDEQVDALLVEVTGTGDPRAVEQVSAALDPAVARAREDFIASLSAGSAGLTVLLVVTVMALAVPVPPRMLPPLTVTALLEAIEPSTSSVPALTLVGPV